MPGHSYKGSKVTPSGANSVVTPVLSITLGTDLLWVYPAADPVLWALWYWNGAMWVFWSGTTGSDRELEPDTGLSLTWRIQGTDEDLGPTTPFSNAVTFP